MPNYSAHMHNVYLPTYYAYISFLYMAKIYGSCALWKITWLNKGVLLSEKLQGSKATFVSWARGGDCRFRSGWMAPAGKCLNLLRGFWNLSRCSHSSLIESWLVARWAHLFRRRTCPPFGSTPRCRTASDIAATRSPSCRSSSSDNSRGRHVTLMAKVDIHCVLCLCEHPLDPYWVLRDLA